MISVTNGDYCTFWHSVQHLDQHWQKQIHGQQQSRDVREWSTVCGGIKYLGSTHSKDIHISIATANNGNGSAGQGLAQPQHQVSTKYHLCTSALRMWKVSLADIERRIYLFYKKNCLICRKQGRHASRTPRPLLAAVKRWSGLVWPRDPATHFVKQFPSPVSFKVPRREVDAAVAKKELADEQWTGRSMQDDCCPRQTRSRPYQPSCLPIPQRHY